MAPLLYRKFVAKRLLIATLVIYGASLSLFTITSSYALLMISRFITGFAQVIIYLYLPAWLDLRASGEKQKTVMMSILLYMGALGFLLGYVTTAQIVSYHKDSSWHWAFYIQIFVTFMLCLLLLPLSVRNLDLKILEVELPAKKKLDDKPENY